MAYKKIPPREGDLFVVDSSCASQPARIFTVSEITQDIKLILENAFSRIWVQGEVSGFSKIATGTVFFNLKDSASVIKCVLFFSVANALQFEIKDGMQLVCCGRISVWEKDGRYQFYVEQAEPKGIGSLQLALEQRKAKLEKEGLFDPAHKKPLPALPGRIGVVTSLQGAAIEDILKVLDRRFKDIHIIISPARVQGEDAKGEIAQAIADLNRYNQTAAVSERIEVMIVGRGGGSIEDLWAFNEEIVARAIYSSKIPVISAVGHERDWTIADLVADVRAPTPSVAAELVIPKKEDLVVRLQSIIRDLQRSIAGAAVDFQERLDDLAHRLTLATGHVLERACSEFDAAQKKLRLLNPAALIISHLDKILDASRAVRTSTVHCIALKEAGFRRQTAKLTTLSPLNILGRGYSIAFRLPEGTVVKSAGDVQVGSVIKTKLHRGVIVSKVTDVELPG
jgi:exodeoxyribonuclease VII large subunit